MYHLDAILEISGSINKPLQEFPDSEVINHQKFITRPSELHHWTTLREEPPTLNKHRALKSDRAKNSKISSTAVLA